MSLAGLGVAATWHDVADGAHDEFREWHTREWMPARAGIPGVRRVRRYTAIGGSPEFCTLLEADSLEVLAGQDYRRRVAATTTAAQRVLPTLRHVVQGHLRSPFTTGVASGGVLLTLRFAIDGARRDSTLDALRRRVLPPLPWRMGVTGVHLCVADAEAAEPFTTEPGLPAPAAVEWVLLVEGLGAAAVEGAADDLAPALQAHAARDVARNTYRLECTRLATPWAAG
ncbi:MAG: hypothetical protein U1F10_15105 [Burkholderiales bacterium]